MFIRMCKLAWTGIQNIAKGIAYTVSWTMMLLVLSVVTAGAFFWNAPDATEQVAMLVIQEKFLQIIICVALGLGLLSFLYLLIRSPGTRRVTASASRGVSRIVGASCATLLISAGCFAIAQYLIPNKVAPLSLAASNAAGKAIYTFDKRTTYLTRKLDLPKIESDAIRNQKLALPTVVYDADNREVGCFAKEYRIYTPLTPEVKTSSVVNAILASEDAGFYKHGGFDSLAMTRAALANFVGGRIQSGASTLTMQLIKNFWLSPERTYSRKFREIILSTYVEHAATKEQILELYINFIYLGGGYGVEAAARSYFGKTTETLSPGEAAFIAGLINQPNIVQLHGERGMARALERKDRVLSLMHERGMLTKSAYNRARQEKLEPKKFVRACEKREPFLLHEVNRQIGIKGKTKIAEAGLQIYTTMRPAHQTALEEGCTKTLAAYTVRHPENKDSIRCSALSVEIATGHIVALVPGQDHARDQWSGVTQSQRQAGSVFKPILYAAYLEKLLRDELARRAAICRETEDIGECIARWEAPLALLDNCTVHDSPVPVPNVVGWKGKIVSRHWVKNYPYEGRPRHRGEMSCKIALAESRNTPPIRALGKLSDAPDELTRWNEGVEILVSMAKRLGIESELQHRNVTGKTEEDRAKLIPNYTLPIGSAGVTIEELTEAFLPLVNGGYAQPITLVKRITDSYGATFESDTTKKEEPVQVLDPEVAKATRELLTAVVDEELGTAHSLRREGNFRWGALCGKTGTATNADASPTDAWFVGCSTTHLVVIRVNNIDKTSLGKKETGGRNALPVFLYYAKATGIVSPFEDFPTIEIPKRPLPTVLATEAGGAAK